MKSGFRPAALLPIVTLLALLIPALPAKAADIAVHHARGETVLHGRPKTVLVFDLASLDTLDALGVKVAGVAGNLFPAYLSQYEKAPKVGTLFEPDLEAVAAAEPDLIVVGGRSAAKYGALAEIAPTIDMSVGDEHYLASALRNAETLGRIFGKEKEAEAKIAELRRAIADLKAEAAHAGTGLIVLTTGGHISAFGPGSRFGILHDAFGLAPAAKDLQSGVHGQAVSSEFILKTDPDWLFVIDRDAAIGRAGEAAKQVLDNPLVRETKAWRKGRVVYLDPASWYLVESGLTALQKEVDEVAAALGEER